MTHFRLFLLSNSSTVDPISSINRLPATISYPHIEFHSRKSTITCARTNNKGFLRSQRSKKTLIRLARFAASNFHYMLPEPFNSVIREFGIGDGDGGGGGSGGSWKRLGGGGGGRKRRVNKSSQFWFLVFAAVCCLGFWVLRVNPNFARNLEMKNLELKSDVMLGALCVSMFLFLIRSGFVPEWVLGFCSGGFVVGLSVENKDELQKLFRGFKAMGISRRRRGRRAI
ncbi:hypothetical protein QVD17_23965 [Tagetes erecta]|uniref:Uncharacterized protein n=1 Tax=Tagetes erecta TaxID=13708 RepID=A0AAD8NMI8_TARER|nr:hypothetical protein QVD17_23965 [Tagetes erecta]